jgi:DNA repair ATPase RecN
MGQGVEEQSAQPRLNPRERARALRQSGAVNRQMPARGASARGVSPARVQEEMTGATDQDTTARIEMMREHLDQYYENQRLISKEWTDWQLTEQMLTARVNHMKQQIEAVREDTAKLEGEITDADREKNELAEKNQRLGELREYQRRQVERLERKARTLAGYLPPSLAAKLNPLIERLPPADADPEEIEISVAQRYPTVLAIFNQVEEFNRAIQLEMDTYELETGDEVQVEVLYLGLGQGYMVQVGQEEGGLAGVGNPSAEGWVWERRDDLADEIRKVIRIYEGEGTAEFVGLPATIK